MSTLSLAGIVPEKSNKHKPANANRKFMVSGASCAEYNIYIYFKQRFHELFSEVGNYTAASCDKFAASICGMHDKLYKCRVIISACC